MQRLCTSGLLLAVVFFVDAAASAHHDPRRPSRPATPAADRSPSDSRGPARTIGAVAIASPAESVRLDGELTDTVWTKAVPVVDFVQRDPKEGGTPTHPTEVRVAFDNSAIYVAVRATEPDQHRLVGMLTRRDEGSPSDWIRVAFDSYLDRRTAYEFSVNVAGVKQDRYWFADTNNDPGWDAVWDVAVRRACGSLVRGIPNSVLAVAVQSVRTGHVRFCRDAHDRARERDVHLAAARPQRQRVRVVLRRSDADSPFRRRRRNWNCCRTR